MSKKMTKAQAGRLGGLKAAHSLGEAGVKARGRKGGNTTLDRHGKEHFTRLAMVRNGYEGAAK